MKWGGPPNFQMGLTDSMAIPITDSVSLSTSSATANFNLELEEGNHVFSKKQMVIFVTVGRNACRASSLSTGTSLLKEPVEKSKRLFDLLKRTLLAVALNGHASLVRLLFQ